ncbi:MAG TPA: LEA type 2 family protein [Lacibacter sp.]|nr:LEA type 2 family protein [Lacibacter sp.]
MPEYISYNQFRVEKWGLGESTVALNLVYRNPNKVGFQVRRTEADVYIDGVYLGKAVSDTLIKVDKKSDFEIPILVRTDMKNLVRNAWSALTNKTVLVTAKGTLTAGVAGVFKTIPLDFEGRHEMGLFEP